MKGDPNDVQVGGNHYRRGRIQPWDAMEDWMSHERFVGFLQGNVIKRLQRAGHKGDELEDFQKAYHELGKLIDVITEHRESEHESA